VAAIFGIISGKKLKEYKDGAAVSGMTFIPSFVRICQYSRKLLYGTKHTDMTS